MGKIRREEGVLPAAGEADGAAGNHGTARESVQRMADLKPSVVLPDHGQPMRGEELDLELRRLAVEFDREAVPEHERYVP